MNEKQLLYKSKLAGARVIDFRDFMKSEYSSIYSLVFTLPQLTKLVELVQANTSNQAEAKLKVLVNFLRAHANASYTTYSYSGKKLKNLGKQALEKIGE